MKTFGLVIQGTSTRDIIITLRRLTLDQFAWAVASGDQTGVLQHPELETLSAWKLEGDDEL